MNYLSYFWAYTKIGVVTAIDTFRAMTAVYTKGPESFHKYSVNWAKKLLKYLKVELEVYNSEVLSKNENYVYITNHTSMADIPIVLWGIKDNIRIIYKKELEKIPIFGPGLRRSPFIAVSRGNGRDAMQSLNEAATAMQEKESILIFPEGTRSKTGIMGEFKRGAFLLAEKANKKIVPITIIGSNQVDDKQILGSKVLKVKMYIHQPVELPENRNKIEMQKFINSLRTRIEETLLLHSGE